MIKLMVIDDHPTIIEGLKSMFRPYSKEISITQTAKTIEQALDKIDPTSFDLIMLDLWVGATDPLKNIKMLQHRFAGKPIIILTSELSSRWCQAMMAAGASAYVQKSIERNDLKQVVTLVAQGHKIFPKPEPNQFDRPSQLAAQLHPPLTKNELLVLKLLVLGNTQKDVASQLASTVSYIEKVVKELKTKYNTDKLSILVAKAMDHPLLKGEG